MHNKDFRVDIFVHKKTGLLMATSEDLKGFMAHGRTDEELDRNIAAAMKALLEAQGFKVDEMRKVSEDSGSVAFRAHHQTYSAHLVAA